MTAGAAVGAGIVEDALAQTFPAGAVTARAAVGEGDGAVANGFRLTVGSGSERLAGRLGTPCQQTAQFC